MYIYTACDITLLLLYYRLWSFSLWALHSASGLHHSTDSLVAICYMCVFETSTSAGAYSAFRPIDQSGTGTWKCMFCEINENVYVLMFPRYFRYSIGSTDRIHRDGGDRSINGPFTSIINKFFFVKEWEKKRNPEVIGREGDEIGDVKIKEK